MRILLLATLLVFLVGCDPMAVERVPLKLPSTAEVDAATRAGAVIDDVLKQHDFRQNPNPQTNATWVASYKRDIGNLVCVVNHHPGKVEVVFEDWGRFRSRPEAIKARDALRQRLIEKFGKEKVSK